MKYEYKKVDLSLDDIKTISKKIKKATAIANKQLADTFDYKEDTDVIEIIEAHYQTDEESCEIDLKAKLHIIFLRDAKNPHLDYFNNKLLGLAKVPEQFFDWPLEFRTSIPATIALNASEEFIAGFLVSNSLIQYKMKLACGLTFKELFENFDNEDEYDEVEYE